MLVSTKKQRPSKRIEKIAKAIIARGTLTRINGKALHWSDHEVLLMATIDYLDEEHARTKP